MSNLILCVGALGSGKSTLLKILQQHGQDLESAESAALAAAEAASSLSSKTAITPVTTPTMGTDLLTVTRCDQIRVNKGIPEEKAMVREVGGAMAPIWSSFVEPGKTKAVLYVVDSSSPETIGASTVHLVELLSHPSLEGLSVMIVFSKLDRQTARQLHELKSLMRLEQIVRGGNHDVSETTFNIKSQENISDIFNWCMKFRVPILPTDMPYNFPLA